MYDTGLESALIWDMLVRRGLTWFSQANTHKHSYLGERQGSLRAAGYRHLGCRDARTLRLISSPDAPGMGFSVVKRAATPDTDNLVPDQILVAKKRARQTCNPAAGCSISACKDGSECLKLVI